MIREPIASPHSRTSRTGMIREPTASVSAGRSIHHTRSLRPAAAPQRSLSSGSPGKPAGSWAPNAFWNIANCV